MKRIVSNAAFPALAAITMIFASGAKAASPVAKPDKVVTCAACHGENGVSAQPIWPNLAGQQENYIEHALHAYKTGERKNAIMAAQAASLSDDDIKQLAKWFAQQTPVLYTPDLEPKEESKK